jgi:hypothetical protein
MVVYLIVMNLYGTNVTMMPSVQMCERIGNTVVAMDKKKRTIYKCVK